MANQNITLKEVVTFLASNKVQILKNYTTGLEIKAIAIKTRIKQWWLKSAIKSKDKATLATAIKKVEC